MDNGYILVQQKEGVWYYGKHVVPHEGWFVMTTGICVYTDEGSAVRALNVEDLEESFIRNDSLPRQFLLLKCKFDRSRSHKSYTWDYNSRVFTNHVIILGEKHVS